MSSSPQAVWTYSLPDVAISDRSSTLKILAIQFRYLGDAALMTPALRAIREHFPGCALHVLVAEEVVPLLQHLPGLARVWAFPRRRGRAKPALSWPVIRALRRERFDRSVDFGGNDRGAIVSLLCGARQRLGPLWPGGFLGRRFFYTHTRRMQPGGHQSLTNFQLLSAWGIAAPDCPRLEICPDPGLAKVAEQLLPRPAILCHLATSQPKKEWPLAHWAELYRRAAAAGQELVFSTGISPREQALLEDLKQRLPGRSRAAGAAGPADLPGRAQAGAIVHQRGHRAPAFCRGAWCADHRSVRPLPSRQVGAAGQTAPGVAGRYVHLWRRYLRLP